VLGVESEHLCEQERRAGRNGWAGLALNPALSAGAVQGGASGAAYFPTGTRSLSVAN
jgi:hypothetical protein